MLIGLTIHITIYSLIAFAAYNYVRIAHSKNGRFQHIDTSGSDLFLVFCPIINILYLLAWIVSPPKKGLNKTRTNKFFNVKK